MISKLILHRLFVTSTGLKYTLETISCSLSPTDLPLNYWFKVTFKSFSREGLRKPNNHDLLNKYWGYYNFTTMHNYPDKSPTFRFTVVLPPSAFAAIILRRA
uniref:Uncharacterized protein n=1 Tax=Cucumis melo TaxID=3656 RepID=A0A9I9ECX5_CUCME